MAMGSLTMNVAQLAEAIYLGIVGTEALAAMGFAFPLTILLFAFAGGIGTGSSSVIARTAGAGNKDRAAYLVTHAELLAIIIGVLLGLVGYAVAPQVITILGATGVVRDMTIDYLRVYMIGVPFFMLSIVGSTVLRATGSAASPGIVMTAGSVLQIIIGPILIFGWFGLPELGIAGAAWAYVISRILSCVLYAWLLIRANMVRWTLTGAIKSWTAILHVGGRAIASGLVMPFSMMLVTKLLAGHGHEVVAGFNVASRVETMAHMILWSVSSSAEPFVGQNWGAAIYQRVKSALKMCHVFCLVWGVFTFLLMQMFGTAIASLIDDNETVVAVAYWFFLYIPLSIGFMGMTQVASSSFNALGKPAPPFVISLLRTIIIYVPLVYAGDYFWGYQGIFLATAVTNVGVGLLAWRWNNNYINRKTRSLESQTP